MDIQTLSGVAINRIYGVVTAVVIDNKDPEGLYRVKVKFPWVQETTGKYSDKPDTKKTDFPSAWARIATMMAGPDRGAFWLPEVDDEVLVVFEHGDLRRPFVIGALWSPIDKAIHDNKSQGGKNWFRTLFSRSGHVIQFIDNQDGKEKIVLQTKVATGQAATDRKSRDGHFIVLDHTSGEEKIEIYDRKQENYVLIDSTNKKISVVSAKGDILLSAPQGKIRIECKTLETASTNTTTMKSKAPFKIQGDATMDIKSSSVMTVQGSQVKIN
ncbi:MAG: phage tail protein [Deltaproteobacteria bacterium]|nr:phage tail protein [Deltaproteobacteria bacterium]